MHALKKKIIITKKRPGQVESGEATCLGKFSYEGLDGIIGTPRIF